MRRWFVAGGLVFLALTTLLASWALEVGWRATADFDVTGLLALLVNLPVLFLWGITAGFAGLTLYCFVHAFGWRSSGLERLSSSSEEQRLMADPRFIGKQQ